MDVSSAIKILLVFLCFSLITNLIVSYFVLGVLISKVISILTGVLLLALTGYLIFFIIKSDRSLLKMGLFGATAVIALAGALACFCRTKYITEYTQKMPRFFLAFFTSLGLYEIIAFAFNTIIDIRGFWRILFTDDSFLIRYHEEGSYLIWYSCLLVFIGW